MYFCYTVKAKVKCHEGAWRERRYSLHSFLTSALDGVSGQRHAQTALCPRESTPGTHWIGGWVDFRAGLDTEARGKIRCLFRGSNPLLYYTVIKVYIMHLKSTVYMKTPHNFYVYKKA
jgi:hypothetical protein